MSKHTVINSENTIIDAIKQHKWQAGWLDFSVFLYEKGRLVIVGSDDLSYYHNLEITIEMPSYIHGVMEWSCDPDEEFINIAVRHNGSRPLSVLQFYADNELKFRVDGENIAVNFDTVFYYKREHLTAGQRWAYWLK